MRRTWGFALKLLLTLIMVLLLPFIISYVWTGTIRILDGVFENSGWALDWNDIVRQWIA